jgi:hypothetical protein
MKNICRFDLDLYGNGYELTSEGICDNCGKFSFERVDCPRQFVDFGDKGIGPYFMCEECCDNDFSEGPADCLANDCGIANTKFRSLSDKKSIFIDFLAELNIKNYSIEDNIFKFNIGNFESVIISLDKRYERKENLSLLKRNIELFDAHYYRKYCKVLEKQWFGIEESYVEFLRNIGFFVNECDILHSSDIKTPIIRFTSSMGIYGYTPSFFIQEQSLNFVEIHPYNVESIFQKEYKIPYFHEFGWSSSIFKDLEKALHKNIHYKLITALRLIQNREKLKNNQKIEILHYLSTYFDLAFTELYNKRFSEKGKSANFSLDKLIKIEKIKSKAHTKEELNELRKELTKYNESISEFEKKILALIYSGIIEIKGKNEDLSLLNPHLADLLISILIRNFYAHRADSTKTLTDRNYNYSKIALFSSILSIYYLFIVDDYSVINDS